MYLSLYAGFIYGLLYLFLTAFSFIFQGVYHMRPGVSGLPELSAVVGCAVTLVVMILRAPRYRRKLEANNGVAIPEWRLPEAMVGGVFFAGGLFWLGWSGYREEVHWIVPIIGGAVTGFGISLVFLQQFNYLIDAYTMVSINILTCIIQTQTAVADTLNSSRHRLSRQMFFYARYSALCFLFLHLTCSKALAFSGPSRY